MWCIPPEKNAEFVCCMENVLETYQQPYSAEEPVVCMDEVSVQLIGETKARNSHGAGGTGAL